MSSPITVVLKDPVQLPNNEILTTVTVKKPATGELALARAAIVRDKRFGREMVDDNLTLAIFILPKMVVASNVVNLTSDWVFRTSENDLEQLANAYGALRGGFDSVDAFLADQKAKQETQENPDSDEAKEAAAQESLPAGEAPTE